MKVYFLLFLTISLSCYDSNTREADFYCRESLPQSQDRRPSADSMPVSPELVYVPDSSFVQKIVEKAPLLSQVYMPPIWGRSGHLHTCIYGVLGRIKSPLPQGKRCINIMSDGATSTFDLYPAISKHSHGDITILVCPGIANSSESIYIRTFVQYAQKMGFRVCVLNHLGVMKSVPITSNRIFNYGSTEEFGAMCEKVRKSYPHSKFILCGFSMGGSIVLKYVGEHPEKQSDYLAVFSICCGYDAVLGREFLTSISHFRFLYTRTMAGYVKKALNLHYDQLFDETTIKQYGPFDLNRVFQAKCLVDIDEAYTIKRFGFKTANDLYKWASCSTYMPNIDKIPVFLLNAKDDPLVPDPLIEIGRNFVRQKDNRLIAVTRHGGHLGFFEGFFLPRSLTWLDKVIIQTMNAFIDTLSLNDCSSTDKESSIDDYSETSLEAEGKLSSHDKLSTSGKLLTS